jgi:hypothetical protein
METHVAFSSNSPTRRPYANVQERGKKRVKEDPGVHKRSRIMKWKCSEGFEKKAEKMKSLLTFIAKEKCS